MSFMHSGYVLERRQNMANQITRSTVDLLCLFGTPFLFYFGNP